MPAASLPYIQAHAEAKALLGKVVRGHSPQGTPRIGICVSVEAYVDYMDRAQPREMPRGRNFSDALKPVVGLKNKEGRTEYYYYTGMTWEVAK